MATFKKIIWIFWEQGWSNAPAICKYCKESWKLLNTDWKLFVLDKNNLSKYINVLEINENFWEIEPIQIRADAIRICLLKRYGGVWVDATTICMEPLDNWLFKYFDLDNKEDFFSFLFFKKNNVSSNWFLVSHKNNHIIKSIYDIFVKRLNNTLIIKKYFQFYIDFTHLLLTDKLFNEYFYKNKKLPSEPAKFFENKFYTKIKKNTKFLIETNYSPIYKLSHKVKYRLSDDIYLYELFKYINLDICNKSKEKIIINNLKDNNILTKEIKKNPFQTNVKPHLIPIKPLDMVKNIENKLVKTSIMKIKYVPGKKI